MIFTGVGNLVEGRCRRVYPYWFDMACFELIYFDDRPALALQKRSLIEGYDPRHFDNCHRNGERTIASHVGRKGAANRQSFG